MSVSPQNSQLRRVARFATACRVLAIALAVLSVGGRNIALRAVAASTTAISASSSEWRALAAAHGGLERATDAAWDGRDGDVPPALLPSVGPWVLGPAVLARVVAWSPASDELLLEGRAIACVARGPPVIVRS